VADLLTHIEKGSTQFLKLPELGDFAFGFANRSRCRQSFADGLALKLVSKTKSGTVAGVIRFGTTTGRFAATTDDSGDGSWAKIAQVGKFSDETGTLLFEFNKGLRHGVSFGSISERIIYVQNRASKKETPNSSL
jgi:hypothetical protein